MWSDPTARQSTTPRSSTRPPGPSTIPRFAWVVWVQLATQKWQSSSSRPAVRPANPGDRGRSRRLRSTSPGGRMRRCTARRSELWRVRVVLQPWGSRVGLARLNCAWPPDPCRRSGHRIGEPDGQMRPWRSSAGSFDEPELVPRPRRARYRIRATRASPSGRNTARNTARKAVSIARPTRPAPKTGGGSSFVYDALYAWSARQVAGAS